jgi:hypothetical protein
MCNPQNATTTATEGTLRDSGAIGAPYSNNENCSLLIQPLGGGTIEVQIQTLITEAGFDILSIYDGTSTSGTLLAQASGNGGGPQYYYANSGSAFITFVSNASQTRAGFIVNWSTTP